MTFSLLGRLRGPLLAALLLPAFGISVPASASDTAPPCRPQADLTRFADRLPRTAERIARHQPLTIVALGSSSTAGAGASSPDASYPSRMAARLRETLPGQHVTVLNRGVNGEDAQDMLARLEAGVLAERPDLVLWQIGTNALLRGHSLDGVRTMVADGIARIRRQGIDVVLIDPQYAPSVLAKPQAAEMLALLARMAREGHADLFPRFAVMKRWHETERIPIETFIDPDGLHMNDWSYACFGRLMADAITEAATRPATVAAVPPVRPASRPLP
ncbi:SGNH/GDSL hydrolase family protein [Rhodoplanes sp. TEM]|uniref:SGNH/GDSL hydrolase family protein n=1 Tax=Rhodoplanes tepidamans TaxID=200616 RepID=A0ABT5J9A1_RHOTP|nr:MULTISPECIES: SGNH/GDSL hydrolase family protein [Rhodoplanes]MDC7786234.1 SGNH/GDSL hydrolase family protein [Rhodoplanes tepidamans]MDC7982395.1 SGNH/GDSL hydrolase family protein [Rhodoplanes sp. TEM]MDQ0355033.1 lysophospholipase L1-like esterase [Rhodoplanes tepidamans]